MNIEDIFDELTVKLIDINSRFRKEIYSLIISEKADNSLLTNADLEIQELIKQYIPLNNFDLITEENNDTHLNNRNGDFWVIDPIDGTKEFIKKDGKEFCNVIAFYKSFRPYAALVVAPELGFNKTPLVFKAFVKKNEILLNNKKIVYTRKKYEIPKNISVTRSIKTEPRIFEKNLEDSSIKFKTRTTSQTLDQMKLFINMKPYAVSDYLAFDIFYRKKQKLWDGAAGIVFAKILNFTIIECNGNHQIPISKKIFEMDTPIFNDIIIGENHFVQWFLKHLYE